MTPEVALVLGVLVLVILLFVTEALRTDVVALLVMLALPWLGLIEPADAFRGFSSGAVVSIMAVLVMGHGLERSGVTRTMARPLAQVGGQSPRRLLAVLLGSVGLVSAFIQNVGAAALFLPVAVRLGEKGVARVSQLMMPLGFAAILGGTLTMIASSSMIVLNDLVTLQGEEPFGLFAVTPIGLVLLGAGVLLLSFWGPRLLPKRDADVADVVRGVDLIGSWSFFDNIEEAMIEESSPLVGLKRNEAKLIDNFGVHVVAVRQLGRVTHVPSAETRFAAGQRLALMGRPGDIHAASVVCHLRVRPRPRKRLPLVLPENTLYAEVLIPPGSPVVGETPRDVGFRRNYGVEPLALLSGGERHLRGFSGHPLRAGDMILLHGSWKDIRAMGEERSFALLTHVDEPRVDRTKSARAVIFFSAAIVLALAGVSLPVALLSGALGMVLSGVMSMDEAYRAISWRTVSLLAGLIPLGMAMDSTGAAAWLAEQVFRVVGGAPDVVVLLAVGALTTLLTLFLSNVATTVVLAPLAMGLGRLIDLDPRALALLVAICSQNSFLLPTHQVNALLMSPGGYRTADYFRLGGVLTAVFLAIAVGGVYLLF